MSRKLFVGNLPYSVTSERLQEAFSQFGTVASSKVIVDRETGRSRGFAFLEMETDEMGAAAMQAMNGALLDGRSIAVREAVERQPGGGGGGGFGGGGGRGPRPPYGGGGGGGDRGGGGGGYRGAAPAGDGGPMRDRRADFSGAPPAPGGFEAPPAGDKSPPRRDRGGPARRERDYEPRKRGFDDDQ